MFDLKTDPRDLSGDASQVFAMARRGESRMALVQKLGQIQSNLCGTVIPADCEKLADDLIKYVPRA